MKSAVLMLGLIVLAAACTSSADASGPREIDIVTVFGEGQESASDDEFVGGVGTRSDGDTQESGEVQLPLPTVDPSATTTSVAPLATTEPEGDEGDELDEVDVDDPDATSPPTTTQITPTTTAPTPVWRVGLLNQEDSQFGSFPAFRVGVAAAVNWANGQGHTDGDRTIELVPCRVMDAATSASCAQELLDAGVDVVVHGLDLFSELSLPVLEGGQAPTLGGIALRGADARSVGAALTVGGPPAEHAAIAAALVAQGFGSVAIVHDDSLIGVSLVDEFIVPVLDAAGVTSIKVPVPVDTTDATGAIAPAAVADTDSWIVVTSSGSCQPVIVSRSQYGVTGAAFYSSSCTDTATLGVVGHLMDNSWFTTEIVTPLWFGVINPDLRDARSLAAAIIAQTDPSLADDPLAIMGYVAATTTLDQLRRGGASLDNAMAQVAPHPLGGGELDCGQSAMFPAMCSADVLLARYVGGVLVGPPETLNGIRGR